MTSIGSFQRFSAYPQGSPATRSFQSSFAGLGDAKNILSNHDIFSPHFARSLHKGSIGRQNRSLDEAKQAQQTQQERLKDKLQNFMRKLEILKDYNEELLMEIERQESRIPLFEKFKNQLEHFQPKQTITPDTYLCQWLKSPRYTLADVSKVGRLIKKAQDNLQKCKDKQKEVERKINEKKENEPNVRRLMQENGISMPPRRSNRINSDLDDGPSLNDL